MEKIIAQLFAARDTAHRLHLRTRSFAQHIALGDLYEGLLDSADTLAEIYQGKYGVMTIPPNVPFHVNEQDTQMFIKELAAWADVTRSSLHQSDTNIVNEWDTLITIIYRAKYKLENLS